MNIRACATPLLAALPTALANAQPPDPDNWLDRQVEEYVESAGISAANRMLWCDPVPRCETIPLDTAVGDSGSSLFVIVIVGGGQPTHADMEFIKAQVDEIRASGGDIMQAVGLGYEFAVALRHRLSRDAAR